MFVLDLMDKIKDNGMVTMVQLFQMYKLGLLIELTLVHQILYMIQVVQVMLRHTQHLFTINNVLLIHYMIVGVQVMPRLTLHNNVQPILYMMRLVQDMQMHITINNVI